MGSNYQLLRRHNGIQCPPCVYDKEGGYSLHKFKSTRALTCHLRTVHKLNNEDLDKIKKIYSEYTEGSFIELCYKRDILN
jgi:hypothetical protein